MSISTLLLFAILCSIAHASSKRLKLRGSSALLGKEEQKDLDRRLSIYEEECIEDGSDPANLGLVLDDYAIMVLYGSTEYKTWAEHEATAQQCGGHLVSITSLKENICADLVRPTAGSWIGGKKDTASSEFVWSDGAPFGDFLKWAPNQPSNTGGNEDCIVMYGDGTWNDDTCTELKHAIYELPQDSPCFSSS